MKQSHAHQSSGSTMKTKMKKGVMLTRQCALLAVLQSHSFRGSGAWAWLSWPLCLRSPRTAVKVSARLCSHIGARLGKYMLSKSPPTSAVMKSTYRWTSFSWAISRPLASCWLWVLGWRPSLSSWRWPSVPQGHLQFLYHNWLSQDGSKTLEQVIYNIM